MLLQGKKINKWGRNVYVKVPVTNSEGKFSGNVISVGVSLESQLVSLFSFIKKQKKNKTVIMFPQNEYTNFIENS